MGGVICIALADPPLVKGSWQFIAQHKRAAVTSGASDCMCASRQQSIMPVIAHSSGSSPWSGIPASALLPRTVTRTRDVNHFTIAYDNCMEALGCLSRPLMPHDIILPERLESKASITLRT